MKFFEPEDFKDKIDYLGVGFCQELADIANQKLEKEGKVVKGCLDAQDNLFYPMNGHTHKALLVNLEPIEKCNHPIEAFIYTLITNDGPEYKLASCRLCFKKFKLKEV